MTIRTYSDLSQLITFEERLNYLRLFSDVGWATFGFDRYINQKFYRSSEWKTARRDVILRDNGCDLGVLGYEINGPHLIHHMNPMTIDDINNKEDWIFDPEYLVLTTRITHNSIHYGDESGPETPRVVTVRAPDDTKLW